MRPLKGTSILVKSNLLVYTNNLWFKNIYIAPREKGILAIGATEEEKGFDSSIKMDELYFLTNSIWESFTNLEHLELKKIQVGMRPTVIDGNPIIGTYEKLSSRIILNFGHYRHGILLAPITAEIISKYINEEKIPERFKFFSPRRFNLWFFSLSFVYMTSFNTTYFINGKVFECNLKDPFLDDVIKLFLNNNNQINPKIAVAVNNKIVEKQKWTKQRIKDDDKIEIVAPFFGG